MDTTSPPAWALFSATTHLTPPLPARSQQLVRETPESGFKIVQVFCRVNTVSSKVAEEIRATWDENRAQHATCRRHSENERGGGGGGSKQTHTAPPFRPSRVPMHARFARAHTVPARSASVTQNTCGKEKKTQLNNARNQKLENKSAGCNI